MKFNVRVHTNDHLGATRVVREALGFSAPFAIQVAQGRESVSLTAAEFGRLHAERVTQRAAMQIEVESVA